MDQAQLENVFQLEYSPDYYSWALPSDASSFATDSGEFDKTLISLWNKAKHDKALRYDLNLLYKSVQGRFRFTAQLNCERAQQRRKPHHFKSITDPFDLRRFNYTKIKPQEVLMKVSREVESSSDSYIIVNSSPIGVGHSLLIPSLNGCIPQVLTPRSIKLAAEMMLISRCKSFHVIFNSILAMASVNHLHLHLYYWPYECSITRWPTKRLFSNAFTLDDWIAPGFVVQLNDKDLDKYTDTVMHIVRYFDDNEIPHNMFMARARPLDSINDLDVLYVTAYIFPRKPCYGAKPLTTMAPAACELGGQLLVYSTWTFQELTEERIIRAFEEDVFLESGVFNKICTDLIERFNNNSINPEKQTL